MQFLSVYMKIYVLAWDLNKKKKNSKVQADGNNFFS